MKVYETTFIINPQMEDTIIDNKVKVVSDIIADNSGKILHADHMGTRKLAYQIKGLTQGYYASFIFEANPETPKTLDRHFKLDETYLRHLTVVYEGDILEKKQREEDQDQPETKSAETKVKDAEDKPVKTKEADVEAKTEPVAEVKTEPVAEAEVKTETEVKEEVEPKSTTSDESSYNEDDEL